MHKKTFVLRIATRQGKEELLLLGNVLAPFIFTATATSMFKQFIYATLVYVSTLSTSRLYQIELVHQVESLNRTDFRKWKQKIQSFCFFNVGVNSQMSPKSKEGDEKYERNFHEKL